MSDSASGALVAFIAAVSHSIFISQPNRQYADEQGLCELFFDAS